MATIMTKRGTQDNVLTYEHICDTTADMASIDPQYITLGSTCLVTQGESGGTEAYIANSNKEWIEIVGGGSGSGSDSADTKGLNITLSMPSLNDSQAAAFNWLAMSSNAIQQVSPGDTIFVPLSSPIQSEFAPAARTGFLSLQPMSNAAMAEMLEYAFASSSLHKADTQDASINIFDIDKTDDIILSISLLSNPYAEAFIFVLTDDSYVENAPLPLELQIKESGQV